MKDALGDRMKEFYEDRTRIKLPRRTYTIIRIDGKAFHTYTKGLKRPFDLDLIDDMNRTTEFLCKNIQGVKFGYVQSDEISLVLTDFETQQTDLWFDGNLQKMASVAASLATSEFNRLRTKRHFYYELFFNHNAGSDEKPKVIINDPDFLEHWPKQAQFDARVFQITSAIEVENYFIWRQQDATRNSISSVAQSMYSPRELHGKKTDEMQEMIFQKGVNWNDYSPREKRGSVVRKVEHTYIRRESGALAEVNPKTISIEIKPEDTFTRNTWEADQETPVFTQDRNYLRFLLPQTENARLEVPCEK
jgi:tRNA(His) 5'-end guanylyltransferase